MAMYTSFVLLVFLIISVIKVQCLADVSALESNSSLMVIDMTDTKNKTLFDHLPPQSNSNLKEHGQNRTKSWQDELFAKLSGANMFEFSRLLPGFIMKSGPAYVLNLSNNGLNSLSAGIFDKLDGLKGLLLDNNSLGSLNVSIFRGLHSLETLKIDMNNLSSLPNDIFHELISLKKITLNANSFSSLAANLFARNQKLNTVELMQNKANMTDLPLRFFSGYTDLENVSLQSIGLQQLTEDLFWDSCKLQQVDLSKNYLKSLPKHLLRDARELGKLNLSSNRLTILPNGFFTVINKLHQLDLSDNCIIALNDWDIFVGLHSLQMLNMERNSLEMIHPDAFISVPNLKIAKFAHNHLNLTTGLRNLFGQISPFRHCPLLEELDLSYNNVSEMFSDWIVEHSLLRRLNLSHNQFNYLESNDLLFNSSDLYVDLSHSLIKIVNLTQLGKIPKSLNNSRDVTVNLNYNPIDCYCEVYSLERYISKDEFHFIREENLNYVKFLTDNLSCHAPKYFRGKLIKDIPTSVYPVLECSVENGRSAACASGGACDCYISPLQRKLQLDCDRRNLTEAPAWINGWGIYVAYVNLSGNALRKTPDLTVAAYAEIGSIRLDLSRNQIDRIENNNSLPTNLNELNLNHNKITGIGLELVKFLTHRLRKLEIRQNPWSCDPQTLAFLDEVRVSYMYEGGYVWWDVWDMMDFACDNTTITQPCRTQLRRNFINKDIMLYVSLSILLLLIMSVALNYHRLPPQVKTCEKPPKNEECPPRKFGQSITIIEIN